MATIRDVAKQAKVSIASISRYLNEETRSLVHPETQRAIERVITRLHYTPNQSARALSKSSHNTIGMVTVFSTDVVKSPYYEGLISGIIEGIQLTSYDLKWIMIRHQDIERCTAHELLQKHGVDGIIFMTWRLFPKLVQEIEHKSRLPVVLINDYEPTIRSSILYGDNQNGVEQLIAHFAEKGYKTIGMLRGPEYVSLDARNRYLAFQKSLLKIHVKLNSAHLAEAGEFSEKAGYEAMKVWIEKGKLPRGIFCANDDLAWGALRALTEKKVRVPHDVALAGFDGSPRNDYLQPSLTSVRQPLEHMGRTAVETLLGLIQHKLKTSVQTKFTPDLVIRNSS